MADKDTTLGWLQGVPMQEAMPFGAGATPQGDPTAFSSMLKALVDVPTNLIDTAKEAPAGIPHEFQSPAEKIKYNKLIEASADTAQHLTGIGTPAAETNAAGIFGGRLAKTADHSALDLAKQMESKGGFTPEHIHEATGWFKNPSDNLWRFEIPDNKARFVNTPNWAEDAQSLTGPAGHILSHKGLYEAYPHLADKQMNLTVMHNPPNGMGQGQWQWNTGAQISAPNAENAKSIALHELTHGVQDYEGFAPGGSASTIAYYQEKHPSKIPLPYQKADPLEGYRALAGEVEARNAQTRGFQSPEELTRLGYGHPWSTMDTPWNKQLIVDKKNDILRMLAK